MARNNGEMREGHTKERVDGVLRGKRKMQGFAKNVFILIDEHLAFCKHVTFSHLNFIFIILFYLQ